MSWLADQPCLLPPSSISFFQRVFFSSLVSLVLKSVKSGVYIRTYTHRFENLVRILGVACDVMTVILPIIGLLCLSYFWGVGKSSQCTTICSYTRNVSLTCKSKVLNIFLNVNVFCLFVVFRFSSFIPFCLLLSASSGLSVGMSWTILWKPW